MAGCRRQGVVCDVAASETKDTRPVRVEDGRERRRGGKLGMETRVGGGTMFFYGNRYGDWGKEAAIGRGKIEDEEAR